MNLDLAKFVTYAAFLVDGNPITNLMSIGGKTAETGQNPQAPAIVGGLDTHAVFEGAPRYFWLTYKTLTNGVMMFIGDASMTRADAFFGDNHSFNQTLWDEVASPLHAFSRANFHHFPPVRRLQ
jgi:hypothetical protein